MKSYDIEVTGTFVNYFTVEAEDEEMACSIAIERFYGDFGDCIDVEITDVDDLEEGDGCD